MEVFCFLEPVWPLLIWVALGLAGGASFQTSQKLISQSNYKSLIAINVFITDFYYFK